MKTVKDLIDDLQRLDPKLPVVSSDCCYGYSFAEIFEMDDVYVAGERGLGYIKAIVIT